MRGSYSILAQQHKLSVNINFSIFYHCSYSSSSDQCHFNWYKCYRRELFCNVYCNVDDSLFNIVVITTVVKIGKGVVSSSESSGDNNVSISYTPLMTSHSGQYQCVVNISQISISYQVSYFEAFTIKTTRKL